MRSTVKLEAALTVLLLSLLVFKSLGVSNDVTVTVKKGSEVLLECPSAITNKNLTQVSWLYRKQSPPDSLILTYTVKTYELEKGLYEPTKMDFYQDSNYSLKIKSTEVEDSGDYKCQGVLQISNNVTVKQEQLFEDVTAVVIYDVPSAPPGKPEMTVNNATSLTVTWETSEIDNQSPVTSYIITLKSEAPPTQATSKTTTFTFSGLDPYTEYTVEIQAVNQAGASELGEPSEPVRTDEAAPVGKPRQDGDVTNSSTSIFIRYRPPPDVQLRGVLLGYHIEYWAVESEDKGHQEIERFADQTSVNLTSLQPYTMYAITLQVVNKVDRGPALEIFCKTDEGVPSEPRITQIQDQTDTKFSVVWERPKQTNGILRGYYIFWKVSNDEDTEHTRQKRIDFFLRPADGERSPKDQDPMKYTIENLDAYTEYGVQVVGYTGRGNRGNRSSSHPAITDVIGPSKPLNVTLAYNASVGIIVHWLKPRTIKKEISRYVLKYRSQDSAVDQLQVLDVVEMTNEAVIWDLFTPGMMYTVTMAGETKSLYPPEVFFTGAPSDPANITIPASGRVKPPHQAETYTAGIIASVICSAIALVAIVILFLITRRYLQTRYQFNGDPECTTKLTSTTVALPESYDESEHNSIPVSQFERHVTKNHADGDLLFSQEYDDINQGTRVDIPSKSSADPENKLKNRYINIVAYDHNRVCLKPQAGRPKGDYINANYVDGYHKPRAYIAAQGPLPTTFTDFWWMVWEENSSAIIMITNLTERGRRKCDQYWPTEGEHQYGQMSVKLLETYVTAYYTIRIFNLKNLKLKKKSGERLIKQFHYTSWPDHGVPDYTLPVLMYVKRSTSCFNSESCGPPIVHCSAGVGRTGTYIVIDSMMRQIEEKDSISVFGFLSHIRNQRNYLVQTEDQYIFIHDALLEYIRSGDTEIPDGNLATYIDDLYSPENETQLTLLQKQYQLVSAFVPDDYLLQGAMLPVNIQKNRSKTLLPIDTSRVRLPVRPAVEGSDFINASYLQGYNKKEEYIVTQHPLKDTVEDFWRMVWDRNSMSIVLLSKPDEQDLVQFWPEKETTRDCGHFKVTFTEEVDNDSHVTRDFLLQSTQDDYECTTRMISTVDWPECCSPLNTSFELIQTVKQWDRQHDEVEGPIIVVDRFGGAEAGTFCALSTLYDQLRHSGSVDVYMTSKLYHLQRPGIFPKEENFHFLYKVLYSVCDDSTFLGEKDSGISNCNNFPATPTHLSLVRKSTFRGSSKDRQETTM